MTDMWAEWLRLQRRQRMKELRNLVLATFVVTVIACVVSSFLEK